MTHPDSDMPSSPLGPETFVPASLAQDWQVRHAPAGNADIGLALAWRLEGPVDRRALQRAVHAVVEDHELLRSRFVRMGHDVVQVIAPARMAPPPIVRVRASASARYRSVRGAVGQMLTRPVPLGSTSHFRCVLFDLGSDATVLAIVVSHTIWDARSTSIFRAALLDAYDTEVRGRASSAGRDGKEPPLQFADASERERHIAPPHLARASDVGRRLLWDAAMPDPRGSWELAEASRLQVAPIPLVPASTLLRIRRATDAVNSTVAVGALVALALLLHSVNGLATQVISLERDTRTVQTYDVLGCLADEFPLAFHVSPAASFHELVHAAHTEISALRAIDFRLAHAYGGQPSAHQHPSAISFNLTTGSQPARSSGTDRWSIRSAQLPLMTWWYPFAPSTWAFSCFNVTLHHPAPAAAATGWVCFNPQRLDRATAATIAVGYRLMLDVIAAHPRAPLHRVLRLYRASLDLRRDGFHGTEPATGWAPHAAGGRAD